MGDAQADFLARLRQWLPVSRYQSLCRKYPQGPRNFETERQTSRPLEIFAILDTIACSTTMPIIYCLCAFSPISAMRFFANYPNWYKWQL